MKKRILSLFLAVFVLLAAMPFSTVMAEETATEIENNNSFAAEITLSEPDFPKTVTTYKVANNFPTEADTFRNTCENKSCLETSVNWDPGATADVTAYANISANGTVSIENNAVTFTSTTKANQTMSLVFKSFVDTDTNYIAVDVDASGLTANVSPRMYIAKSSSGDHTMYASSGQTYYFLPEATEDDPKPTLVTRTMSTKSNYYDARLSIKKGEKGTFYFPETMFVYDPDSTNGNNALLSTCNPNWVTGIYGDFSKLITTDEEFLLRHINGGTEQFRGNRLAFVFWGGITVGDSLTFSNMRWVSNVNFPLDYNAEYIDEDFSDAEATVPTGWADNGKGLPTFSIEDGALTHTLSNESWIEGTFNYGYTVDLDYPATQGFEAMMYDVDFSNLTTALRQEVYYNVRDNNGYVRRFIVSGGSVYAVWENGVVETISVNTEDWAKWTLPLGFKGTVVIPFDALKNSTVKDTDCVYDGTQKDLYKTDDANKFSISIITRDIAFEDNGKVITNDNFGYLTTIKPILEEGTVFSADAPVETDAKIAEEIDTIEAWVKIPEGTAAGTILANKYRIENTTTTDSIVLSMNASGNPVLYLSDGDGLAVNFEVSDVDLRTDKWTHIAFVKNTETATVNCYINGLLQSSTEIPEGFAEVKPYHALTIGHYIADELGTATFGGEVANLKLWSKALTSSEILSSAINEATVQDGLISAWTLNGENAFVDIAGNYDLEVYDLYITAEDEAYADYSAMPEDGYTFAVLPDTQIAAQREAVTGDSDGFSKMYQWMIDNKDALNLKFAMGVGDITNKDKAEEYILAKENFDKLTAAGIGWSVVGGNHDFAGGSVAPNNTTNLNTYFPASEIFTYSWFGGFKDENKIDSAYYYVTVSDTKYLILNLMCEPYDADIEWANQVCAKNKDCKIIVITHEYLTNDADFMVGGYTGRNHGIDVWNKLVSKHENIIMAIGGHVSIPDIQYREDLGVNGNKVISVLVDGQALDWGNSHNLLMLLKFSKDGSQVTFNYYSPTHGAYLDKNNQFTLDVGGVVSDEAIPAAPVTGYNYTKYHSGEIVRDYEWFVNDGSKLSIWSDSKHSTVSTSNFSWYNNMVKYTAPSEYKINPDTVTDENPDGTAYTSDRVGITIDDLPNVVNTNQTAISIYVDNSFANETTGLRLRYNNGTNAFETYNGSVVYLIDENGNIEEYICTGTHATAYVPKGFKGSVIVPFSSFRNASTDVAATAADMVVETQANSAHYVVYILNATPGAGYVFNNVTYLEEYENADLVTLRKGLMDAENGEDIDVNGDTYVDVRDIVRLKKVLADAFINN